MKRRRNLKKYVVCIVVFLSIFLFLGQKSFSESSPSTILLGETQHFDLESPVVIPFANTREVINEMKQNECNKVTVLFSGSNKPIKITPTLNGALLSNQEVTINPETNTLAGEFELITRNPLTMQKLDPQMNEFGIFFRFNTATESAIFDASFNVKSNCSSGVLISNEALLDTALSFE